MSDFGGLILLLTVTKFLDLTDFMICVKGVSEDTRKYASQHGACDKVIRYLVLSNIINNALNVLYMGLCGRDNYLKICT